MGTMFYLFICLHGTQLSIPLKHAGMKWEVNALPNFPKSKSVPSPNFPYILHFCICYYELLGWHVCPVLCNTGNGHHSQPTEKLESWTGLTVSQHLSTVWMVLYYLSSIFHDHLSADTVMVFQRLISSHRSQPSQQLEEYFPSLA